MGSVLNMEPLTIALVGCGKSKLDHAAPAHQLYTGSLFVAASRWAAECDGWFILSAKFGLLDPEAVIEPYEVRLGPKDRQQWGQVAANAVVNHMREAGPYELVLLAGEDYAAPVREAMRGSNERGWRLNCMAVRAPLEGLGIGQRLAWFKSERDKK
jgi:hypothetical protein